MTADLVSGVDVENVELCVYSVSVAVELHSPRLRLHLIQVGRYHLTKTLSF